MSFRADWRLPVMWIVISCLSLGTTISRVSHHGGTHDHSAVFQLILSSFIAVLSICVIGMRWIFTSDTLLLRRFPFPQRAIPFSAISSVDWGMQNRAAVVRYDKGSKTRKAYMQVDDMPGFLNELEQRIPADVMHV